MKSRKPILVLAVLFLLISLYHLSFTWKVYEFENEAKDQAKIELEKQRKNELSERSIILDLYNANQDSENQVSSNDDERVKEFVKSLGDSLSFKINERRKIINDDYKKNNESKIEELTQKQIAKNAYFEDGSGAEKGIYNFLGLKEYTYQECKSREISLGLDLQGGISVTLEVSVEDALIEYSKFSQYIDPEDKSDSTLFFRAIESASKLRETDSKTGFVDLFSESFEKVSANTGLARMFETEDLDNIITPKMSNSEVIDKLKALIETDENSIINTTYKTLKERSEKFVNTKPNILKTGVPGRYIVELPGVEDPKRVEEILTSPAELTFFKTYTLNNKEILKGISYINNDTVNANTNDPWSNVKEIYSTQKVGGGSSRVIGGAVIGYTNNPSRSTEIFNEYKKYFPADIKIAFGYFPEDKQKKTFQIYALQKEKESEDGSVLSGDIILDASSRMNEGQYEVVMTMNDDPARDWSKITKENKGSNIAIVLDGLVRSCPTVNQQITGGTSQITGNFNSNEAEDLANVLSSGKLTTPLKIVQQSVVGPSLGKESINAGMNSFLISIFCVLMYMIFYYSRAGVASNIALIVNMILVLGTLVAYGAVLTLPGIAGLVLTIGMSVDANVLIYERIREELANGKGIRLAISDGYKSAYTSIIDANVTTLLTGIILLSFGQGPIKGFAEVLIIGILTSLFSAIFITRLIISSRLNRGKSISFSNKITHGAFKNINIDFLGKRKIFYVISSILIIVGGYSLVQNGLSFGIDFAGGRSYIVNFDKEVKNQDVRDKLSEVFVNEDGKIEKPLVTSFRMKDAVNSEFPGQKVKIVTKYMLDVEGSQADSIVRNKLSKGLKNIAGPNGYKIIAEDKVNPTIAEEIKDSAWKSILFSLLVIFLYIFIRFKKWQFSLGAVVAVFHDVLIVLSVFSIFNGLLPFPLEIDQAFVAAILTIIGYSLNDTVVVFDRVREFITNNRKKQVHELINTSLNSTLSRTINTSLTTFFVLLVIFLFGGEAIKGFMFALMVGVIVGTYSSLFVASPIMTDTMRKTKE